MISVRTLDWHVCIKCRSWYLAYWMLEYKDAQRFCFCPRCITADPQHKGRT